MSGMDGKVDFRRIANVIIESNADIVCLQEVDRSTTRVAGVDSLHLLSNYTVMTFVFGKNLDFQGGGYGKAILSSLPILDHTNRHLKKLSDGEQRGVITARVKLNNGLDLTISNTHLDH